METQRRIRWLRRLAVVLSVWTFALMGIGAWVKATGSGLSCPDWPQCYGQWMPPFPSVENGGTDLEGDPVYYTQAQILYEWLHRAVASLLGIPFLVFVWVAWRGRELHPALRRLPLVAGGVLVVQVLLGGGTVLKGNPDYLTTMHLLTATLFFATVLFATAFAFLRPLPTTGPRQDLAAHQHVAYVYPGETVRFPGEGEA